MASRGNDPKAKRPDRPRRLRGPRQTTRDALTRIRVELCAAPVIDDRSPEEIVGYDADGLPRRGSTNTGRVRCAAPLSRRDPKQDVV